MPTRLRKPLVRDPRTKEQPWRGHRLVWRLTIAYEACIAVLFSLLLSTSVALADVTVSPTAPPGVNALQDLVNWGGYTGAITCLGGAIYGFGKMGLSHKDGNYGASNHGRTVAMMSLAGALGLGIAPTVINTLTGIH
jgi:hypothetical protein